MRRTNFHLINLAIILFLFVCISETSSHGGIFKKSKAAEQKIEIYTWGGTYGSAINDVLIDLFERETNIRTHLITHEFDPIVFLQEGQVQAGSVINLTLSQVEAACASGLLEPLDHEALLGPAVEAFVPGTLHKCGVGSLIFAQSLFIKADPNSDRQPQTVADVFNISQFPGVRIFPADPEFVTVWALDSTGVSRDDIYDTLGQDFGKREAITQLRNIRPRLIMENDIAVATAMFLEEESAILATWNFEAAQIAKNQGLNIDVIKGSQIWSADVWAIVAGSDDIANAQKFIEFAVRPDNLTKLSETTLFGPARFDSDPVFPDNISHLLALPRNLNDATRSDESFWALESERYDALFTNFMAGNGTGDGGGDGGGEGATADGGGTDGGGDSGGATQNGGGDGGRDGTGGVTWHGGAKGPVATRRLMINGQEPEVEVQNAGAFAMVAFTGRVISSTRERFQTVCDQFLSQLASKAEAEAMGVPIARRIVTFWPVRHSNADVSWMGNCTMMIDHYDLNASRNAVKLAEEAAQTGQVNVRLPMWPRRGPYLIAWSPPIAPVTERIFLVMDLSGLDTVNDIATAFRTYRDRVERNPEIWNEEDQFSVEKIRQGLKDFLNLYGEDVADAFGSLRIND